MHSYTLVIAGQRQANILEWAGIFLPSAVKIVTSLNKPDCNKERRSCIKVCTGLECELS